jgi:CheY-like chemotaxis protein
MPRSALIVDSDFFFAKFLGELLENRGYEVIQADDGKQGIAKLEEGEVDLIFINIIMPKMDGKQLIGFIRKKYPEGTFSIIGMLDAIVELQEMLKEIDADYYLQKKPMSKMTDYVGHFLDLIETDPFSLPSDEIIFDPEDVFRRRGTVDLLEAWNFQQGITESAGMGIIVIEKDARIVYANSLTLKILNKSLTEVLSQKITSIFPRSENRKMVNALREVALNQGWRKLAFEITINSEETRVIVSLLKVNHEIAGWVMVLEDIAKPEDSYYKHLDLTQQSRK